jgi:PAS domain S-box-containing protein
MGALMRSFDWTTTPIGSPDSWPQGLRTAVRILLTTQHPMFIWWGPDLIQFYNDAYRKTMGPERHPSALGQRGRECWQEIWDIIGPQIELVMSGGGATWHEDQLVPVTRYGRREDVWWTYSYSPIDDEASKAGVGGVLVVCKDVTGTRRAFQALEASEERLRLALSAGVVGTWDWHMEDDRVYADEQCARFYGLSPEQATAGVPPRNYMHAVHVDDRQRLRESIDRAVSTGEEFVEEYRIVQPDDAVRWVAARGRCYYDADRKPLRFPGAVTDITQQKKANEHRQMLTEELNHRVKNMLTTVQAIARQTLKSGVSIAAARETLDARLMALSRAHDVLVGKSWAGAHIETVITNAVEPHAVDADRFQIDGPLSASRLVRHFTWR